MGFRLGILFSAILLGIVMLYLRSKERWEWDKIIILFTAAIVSISILGGIGIFVYIKKSDKPEIQTSFWDITLSSSKSSIKFIKGPPNKIEPGDIWVYISEIFGAPEAYYLRFNEDELRLVGYLGGDLSGGPSIHGIKKGSSLDDIILFFGKPSQLSESIDNLIKLYSYENYNVFFMIEDNRVSTYGVYNPKYGPMEFEETIGKSLDQMELNF